MNWDLTIEQKDKFLELMNSMGANSMWFLDGIVKNSLRLDYLLQLILRTTVFSWEVSELN